MQQLRLSCTDQSIYEQQVMNNNTGFCIDRHINTIITIRVISRDSKLWNTLQWRHNGRDGVSNHQPHHCLLRRLFGCRSKKTSKLRVTGLCVGNSPVTGEFPAQMASNAKNVPIWWRHREFFGQWISHLVHQYPARMRGVNCGIWGYKYYG